MLRRWPGRFRATRAGAGRGIVAALPEDAGERHRARSVTAGVMRAYGREVAVLPALLDEIARTEATAAAVAFGGLQVRVISATEPGEGESRAAHSATDDTMFLELAARAPTASHLRVVGADHLGVVTDADHAREVVAAAVGLLEEVTDPGGRGSTT